MFAALGPFLAAIAGPIARMVMMSLGIGVVTMVGVNFGVDYLLQQAATNVNSVMPQVGSLLALAGFMQMFSILGGALTACVALMTLKKFTLL